LADEASAIGGKRESDVGASDHLRISPDPRRSVTTRILFFAGHTLENRNMRAVCVVLPSDSCSRSRRGARRTHCRNRNSIGTITVELDRGRAPKSVGQFPALRSEGHYDGTLVYRVAPGFVIRLAASIRQFTRDPCTIHPLESRPTV